MREGGHYIIEEKKKRGKGQKEGGQTRRTRSTREKQLNHSLPTLEAWGGGEDP